METCETCRFWFGDRRKNTRECHRREPAIGSFRQAIWAETTKRDWCGEYSPTPTKEMGE